VRRALGTVLVVVLGSCAGGGDDGGDGAATDERLAAFCSIVRDSGVIRASARVFAVPVDEGARSEWRAYVDRVEAVAPAEVHREVLAYREGVERYVRLLARPASPDADLREAQEAHWRATLAVIDYIGDVC
jgi:hypothetical protein